MKVKFDKHSSWVCSLLMVNQAMGHSNLKSKIKNQKLYRYLFGFTLVVFWSCATVVAPNGGKEDSVRPKLDSSAYSTPNNALNFNGKEVILTFNEWVKISDPNKVIVSPYMKTKPKVELRHKSLVIRFEEPLKPNTTYAIAIGDAVEDITKGNKAELLPRLFSTGAYLDSLQYSTTIKDLASEKIPENTFVLLYPGDAPDTMLTKGEPLYVLAAGDGRVEFRNLAPGKYRVVGLTDKNANYRYDLVDEKIAFTDSLLTLPFQNNGGLALNLFESEIAPRIGSILPQNFGRIELELSREAVNPTITAVGLPNFFRGTDISGKKITLWYADAIDSVVFTLTDQSGFEEQSKVTLPKPTADFLKSKPKMAFASKESAGNGRKEDGSDGKGEAANKSKTASKLFTIEAFAEKPNIEIPLNVPLAKIDTSLIKIEEDSTKNPLTAQTFINGKNIETSATWPLKSTIRFAPNAIEDIYGAKNTDTLTVKLTCQPEGQLAELSVKLLNLPSDQIVLAELRNAENKLMAPLTKVERTSEPKLSYPLLPPGTYTIRFVVDANANNRWDTGDFSTKKQPEQVKISGKFELKPRFDLETEFDWNGEKRKEKK